MIKKQVEKGIYITEVESSISELESLLRDCFNGACFAKQIFEVPTTKGLSMHSVNNIEIESFDIRHFNGFMVISINDMQFSIAINEDCNILMQRPEPSLKCRILFKDFNMWLLILKKGRCSQ